MQSIGDGIAHGLRSAHVRLDEVLRFGTGQLGLRPDAGRDLIGCVLLDPEEGIAAGGEVRGTGDVVRVPVGPGLLGRVVDPLGRPLDGGPPVRCRAREPIEQPAPDIVDRALVTEPVQTGILVIDALFALGRGQRELIIGDRAIGKTSIAVDTIINQKSSDLICIYVAVGQKSSTVARVIDAVRRHGAPERCIFVVAAAAAAPGLQWIAPFAGDDDGRVVPRPRPARAGGDRRSDQARGDASRDRAADAPAAGARGVSGRRVLPARAAAGARGETVAGTRRRVADRAADRGDRCGQSERLYPDQSDFDHRRAARARRAAVPCRPEAGDRCRHQGQPGRRQDAGAGAARR